MTMNPLGSLFDVVVAVPPKDLQTYVISDYVSLKNYEGVLIVFVKAIGTAGEDPTLELSQATTVAGGSAKDLNGFVDIYKKQGVDLTAVSAWTKVSQTADEDFVGDGDSAEQQGLFCAWVPATALDIANGFDCLRCDVKDSGVAAQIGTVLYILCGPRYASAPNRLPSAIGN
jgi:hypothetical protein